MSMAAALAAVKFARKIGAELVGVFVVPELQYPIYIEATPPTYLTTGEYRSSMQTAGDTFLNEIRKAAASDDVPFTGQVVFFNSVPSGIVATAEECGCDMIFIGSVGQSEWHRMLLGSVTSKVLVLTSLPVLVYRPPKEEGKPVNGAGARQEDRA